MLSLTRYDQTQPALGRLSVEVRCKDYDKTLGINPYAMNSVEQEVYEAKVPLNDNGFEYKIRYVYIDVVNLDANAGLGYFARDLLVNESDYAIDCGNLYFTKSLEEIISEKYSGFENFLSQTWASDLLDSTIYYNVRVVFERFVPDTTDETNSLALAQATSYAIMDYFNQYSYAEISSNMISEIAYTETLTFWSTLISAPLVYFGSWAVKGTEAMMAQAGVTSVKAMLFKGVSGMALSPIREVFQEIIEDGFKEALAENIVSILGGTDDLGFWVSSYWTAGREATGALGQLSLGSATNLKTTISLMRAISSGDVQTRLEIQQRIEQDLNQRQETEAAKREQMSFWGKTLKTDLLKGLFMVMPSVLFGSFSFVALSGLNKMVTSSIKLSPAAYAKLESLKHNRRKKATIKAVGGQEANSVGNVFTDRVLGQTKKPAELDSAKADVNEKYKASQETQKENPPLAAFLSSLNPNPKIELRKSLADKFNTLAFEGYFNEWIEGDLLQDNRFKPHKEDFRKIQKNYKKIGVQKAEKEAIEVIKEALSKEGNANLRFVNMFGIEFYDPNFILVGIKSGNNAKIEGNTLKQDKFKTSVSTLDKMNELQKVFDIDSDLDMFVLRGKETTKIPVDSTTNLADWLEDNGFSIDDKILVEPVKKLRIGEKLFNVDNLEDNELSPYLPYFNEFILSLGTQLESLGFIKSDSRVKGVDHYISKIDSIIFDRKYSMETIRDSLCDDSKGEVDQNDINKWYVLVKQKIINEKTLSSENKKIALQSIGEIFEELYKIFGYTSHNTYTRSAYLALEETAMLLHDEGVLNEADVLLLKDVLGYTRAGSFMLILEPSNRKSPHKPETLTTRLIDNPRIFLTGYFKGKGITGNLLTQKVDEIIKKIENIISPYKDLTSNYWDSEGRVMKDIDEGSRKALLRDILHCHPILENILTKQKFSQLLFASTTYLSGHYCHKDEINVRPETKSLSRLMYLISKWNVELFEKVGIDATEFEIETAKIKALKVIKEWIFSNPESDSSLNWELYVKENFIKKGVSFTKDDLTIDFQLSNAIITAVSDRIYSDYDVSTRNTIKFSLTKIANELGVKRKLYRELKQGQFYSKEVLEKTYKKIADWHQEELGDRVKGLHYDRSDSSARMKLYYYQDVLYKIKQYAEIKGIILFEDTVVYINKKPYTYTEILHNEYDTKYFGNQKYKEFHLLFQLGKYLGFEPLTFSPLDDKDTATSKYRLHHFLAEMMRKMSSNVADIVLTSEKLHSTYEKILRDMGAEGEAYIRGLMKSIEDLIFLQDSTSKYVAKIKEENIYDILVKNLGKDKGGKVFLEWTSNSEFSKNLATFNDRRPYAQEGRYRQFLQNIYKETWSNREQTGTNYYQYIRKQWASRVAILFSYDADLNIMFNIYRQEIPLA